MAGEKLQEFDLDLCHYALSQIRPHLRTLPSRPPRLTQRLAYDEFHRLTLPEWLGRRVALLPGPLADHVWAGVEGDVEALPLNDYELYALADCVDDPPLRCEEECVWAPYPALHRRYVECILEIRTALAPTTAEEWAADSVDFARRLGKSELTLVDGFDTTHEWLWACRRLLSAMDATARLPMPTGGRPTPTCPASAAPSPADPDFAESRLQEVMVKLRAAIGRLPDGDRAKADCVIQEAQVQRQIGKRGLRRLEAEGKYHGFARGKPSRYHRS